MGIRLVPEAACAGNDETWFGVVGVLTGSKDIAACVLGRLKAVRESDSLLLQRANGRVVQTASDARVRGQVRSCLLLGISITITPFPCFRRS